jgi:hypothetical protein
MSLCVILHYDFLRLIMRGSCVAPIMTFLKFCRFKSIPDTPRGPRDENFGAWHFCVAYGYHHAWPIVE